MEPLLSTADTEMVRNKTELAYVNEQLGKYKEVFQKIMNDLSPSLPSATAPIDTSDPLVVYDQLMKGSSTGINNLSLSAKQVERIQYEAMVAHSGITVLENRVSAIDHNLQNIAYDLNRHEQHSKGWNLLIRGMKNLPVKNRTTSLDDFEFVFIDYICYELNKYLGNHLHCALQPHDIERAHLLYQGAQTEHPVIIVRFTRRVVRNNIFFKRRFLKGTGIGISDHLTRSNKKLLDEAKLKFGSENTWTSLCKVFASVGGRRYEIKSLNDIDNLSSYISNVNPTTDRSQALEDATVAPVEDASADDAAPSGNTIPEKTDKITPSITNKHVQANVTNTHTNSSDIVNSVEKNTAPSHSNGTNKQSKYTKSPSPRYPPTNSSKFSGRFSNRKKPDLRYNK